MFDIGGFAVNDPEGRWYVDISATDFALAMTKDEARVSSTGDGDLRTGAWRTDAPTQAIGIYIFGDSEEQKQARLDAWFNLIDQQDVVLGRTVAGVRRVADARFSARSKVERLGDSMKFVATFRIPGVYWRAESNETVALSVGANELTDIAESSAPIADSLIMVAGNTSVPLTHISVEDDNSGTGISWDAQPAKVGQYLQTLAAVAYISRAVTWDAANGVLYTAYYQSMSVGGGTPYRVYLVRGASTFLIASSVTVGQVRLAYAPGYIYVATTANVYRFSTATDTVTGTYPTSGSASDIATDTAGNYYLVDPPASLVRKFSGSGVAGITWANISGGDGRIAVDATNKVYVTDGVGVSIYTTAGASGGSPFVPVVTVIAMAPAPGSGVFIGGGDSVELRSASGSLTATFGSHGSGEGQFVAIRDIAADVSNSVLVLDVQLETTTGRVQKFEGDGVFDGVKTGEWLVLDPDTLLARIVTTSSFAPTGDRIGGVTTTAFTSPLVLTPKPNPADMLDRTLPVTVTKTGGGDVTLQVKRSWS